MILYQNTCHLNDESAAEVNTEIDCNNFTCDLNLLNATSFGVALFTPSANRSQLSYGHYITTRFSPEIATRFLENKTQFKFSRFFPFL